MSLLYEADAKEESVAAVLLELPVAPDNFVVELVSGVEERLADIDELINRFAIDWKLDRMPVIDRTLLRMATFELIARDDIPTGATISEAVDLAKTYSTDESGRFVNGMLSSIAGVVRPGAAEPRPAAETGGTVETGGAVETGATVETPEAVAAVELVGTVGTVEAVDS
jgi:N utilization substance protein B